MAQPHEFSEVFATAKERVAKMAIQVLEVDDPETQAIFEVYAAMALGTPHNNFENH